MWQAAEELFAPKLPKTEQPVDLPAPGTVPADPVDAATHRPRPREIILAADVGAHSHLGEARHDDPSSRCPLWRRG